MNRFCPDNFCVVGEGHRGRTNVPAAHRDFHRYAASAIGQCITESGIFLVLRADFDQSLALHETQNPFQYRPGQRNPLYQLDERKYATRIEMLGKQVGYKRFAQSRVFQHAGPRSQPGQRFHFA